MSGVLEADKIIASSRRDVIAVEVMKLVTNSILELEPGDYDPCERIAKVSYKIADAMLAERAK